MTDQRTADDYPTLTREDIAALKAADSITFHHTKGVGYIRARIRVRDGDVLTAKQQRLFPTSPDYAFDRVHEIEVSSSGYGYGSNSIEWRFADAPDCTAFESISAGYEHWQTITRLLRVGDLTTLRWTADNNTGNMRTAGFHHDALQLVVWRGDHSTANRYTFNVVSAVGPDNSARMIRRFGH